MRAADLIVLVKVEDVENSSDRDPRTRSIISQPISGTVVGIYKGRAEKGQAIDIRVPYAELGRRFNEQLRWVGLLFAISVRQGNTMVFLLKGTDYHVLNIMDNRPIAAEYARIAQIDTNGEAVQELLRLYARLIVVEKQSSASPAVHILSEDLKRYYSHLDEKSEAFADMINSFREPVFRLVKDFDGPSLLRVAWIGSYLSETDRKELVTILLDHYGPAVKKLEEVKSLPPEPKVELPPTVGGRGPTPLLIARGNVQSLVISMNMLMDTSWHDQIPDVQQGGEVIPFDLLNKGDAINEETVAKAKKFIEK